MAILIRIISLTNDKLVIEPVSDASLHTRDIFYRPSNLDSELVILKRELALNFNLTAGNNYEEEGANTQNSWRGRDIYRLCFKGKSNVLNALHTIPSNIIKFETNIYLGISEQIYNESLYRYTTTILPNECFFTEIKHIEKINMEIFIYLKEAIQKIHNKFSNNSAIMMQLNADIDSINNQSNTDIFSTPKYYLALAALHFALSQEKDKKLTVKPYTFIKGDSLLAPEYEKIMSKVFSLSPRSKSSAAEFLKNYNEHVRNYTDMMSAQAKSLSTPVVTHATQLKNTLDKAVSTDTGVQSNVETANLAANIQFSLLFFTALVGELKLRQTEIQRRIDNHQWFQDDTKNREKVQAIQEIETAFQSGKNSMEMLNIINARKEILKQSTSTLPTFLQAKVTTATILAECEKLVMHQGIDLGM